jgi:hypothetical protein
LFATIFSILFQYYRIYDFNFGAKLDNKSLFHFLNYKHFFSDSIFLANCLLMINIYFIFDIQNINCAFLLFGNFNLLIL